MAKLVETCRHTKANGSVCGSPALEDQLFCYFHLACRDRIKRQRRAARRKLPFQLPVLEDAASVQLAIGDTLNALLAGQIDHKTAGLVLYGLQTAASNIRHASFELKEEEDYFTEFDTGEEDMLEDEIQDEIEPEQKEAEESKAVNLPAPDKTLASPALPPKKSPDTAADGPAKTKAFAP